jgi:hypothetical protein
VVLAVLAFLMWRRLNPPCPSCGGRRYDRVSCRSLLLCRRCEIQVSPVTAALLQGSYAMQSLGVVQVSDSSHLRVFRLAGAEEGVVAAG